MYCLHTVSDEAEPFDLLPRVGAEPSDPLPRVGAEPSDPASGLGVQVLPRFPDPNQARCIQS